MPYQPAGHRPNRASLKRATWVSRAKPANPTRTLDMIPGGLAWIGLVATVLGSLYTPRGVIVGAAILSAYTAARFALAAIAALWGLRLERHWQKIDWTVEYHRRADSHSLPLDAVQHVVIIPNYREELVILRRTLKRLAAQKNARTSITIVLAMEGKESAAAEKSTRLQREFSGAFNHFLVATHPRGLPGEISCKSANLSWAARWAKRALVDRLGYKIDHLVVTVTDADTLWHPDYFESVGTLFATDPQRHSTYWQAPIRYHGNVWSTHPVMRILHANSAAWELAYLAAPWWRALPMSSYSASMRLLHTAGYWDADVIADEWHMFIKSHFRHRGNIRLQPVFLPFWANTVTGNNLLRTLRARYLQTLRHAWGAKEIGYTVTQIIQHPQTSLRSGLGLLIRVAHDNLLAGLGWIAMVFGSQLPILLHPNLLTNERVMLPLILIQLSALVIGLLSVAFWAIDLHIRPARHGYGTARERFAELLSLPLLAIITFCCVALPVLHAQTRLMLGLPLEFRVTAKT